MQYHIPKKVGCTHACLTAILAVNFPPTAWKTPLAYAPSITAKIRTSRTQPCRVRESSVDSFVESGVTTRRRKIKQASTEHSVW